MSTAAAVVQNAVLFVAALNLAVLETAIGAAVWSCVRR